jgi:glycosyltransferase involved in cell wall biosynthesis
MTGDKLKIAVLCHSSLYAGSEVVLERIVKTAVERGWSVKALTPEGTAADRLQGAGATIVTSPDLRLPTRWKSVGVVPWLLNSLKASRLLSTEARGSDLVVANGIYSLPTLRLARLAVPAVWILHQVVSSRTRQVLIRRAARGNLFTVAVSHAAAESVKGLGLKVKVIHNGTPHEVAARSGALSDPPVVGCAASLTKWKGQDVFLEAAALIDERVKVELLGPCFPKDAPFEKQLRERAAAPDLEGRVSFLGFRDDVLDVIRSWSVAVSASVEPEAVGLTTLEAMSVGVPVVGTDLGATPSVLDGAGLLVPPGDPDAMARAITRLISDPDLWRTCHEKGPAIVGSRFSLERQLDSTLEAFAEAAAGTWR